MKYIHMTDDDYDNPDQLSAARGCWHAFLITSAVLIAIAVGYFWR